MIADDEFNSLSAAYPVLAQLGPQLRQDVQRGAQPLSMDKGQLLFDLHSECHQFVMLTRGTLRVIKRSFSGREFTLYRVQPGDSCILTVCCLLGRADYPAAGIVEEDLAGYSISRELFGRLVEQAAAFRVFVFRFFAERVAALMELVEEIGFRPLEQRLAAALIGRGPVVPITHQTLADEVGSVREVVSRILKEFERRSIVRLKRGQVQILDEALLRRIAGRLGDPGH